MQKRPQVKVQTRPRKFSEQSISNHPSKGKQNSLLSSINHLNNFKASEFLRNKKYTIPFIGNKGSSQSLAPQPSIKTFRLFKNKNENDSFDSILNQQNRGLLHETETKKGILYLPPLESKRMFAQNVCENTFKEPRKQKAKSRGKIHCKIILRKNVNFPFFQSSNKTAKTNHSVQNAEQICVFSDFDELKISLIEVVDERDNFISTQSLKQIALA